MGKTIDLPSREELKVQAKRLRAALAAAGEEVSHGRSLELVAQQHGFRDWNTLHAALGNGPALVKFGLGDRVSGSYLKQPFQGEIIAIATLGKGRRQVTIQFDQPVDVVEFDSFSAFRQRVTAVIDDQGRAFSTTSDRVPHLTVIHTP